MKSKNLLMASLILVSACTNSKKEESHLTETNNHQTTTTEAQPFKTNLYNTNRVPENKGQVSVKNSPNTIKQVPTDKIAVTESHLSRKERRAPKDLKTQDYYQPQLRVAPGKPQSQNIYEAESAKKLSASGMTIGGGYAYHDSSIAYYPPSSNESYDSFVDNEFTNPLKDPLSTFSIDVDTASYANMRRFLTSGQLPPRDSIRTEELINYFKYNYENPKNGGAFSVNVEGTKAPWNPQNQLVKIGIKGLEIATNERPASNLVFLIDVSGSMSDANKLPLLKNAFSMMVDKMDARDRVSIVVYAGAAGMVLPPTSGKEKHKILAALDGLNAGGSTNGGQGIQLAYKLAQDNFIKGGVNRVVLATDGDFNVGITDNQSLNEKIKTMGEKGIYLSLLGFGMGNLKDGRMEELSNKGNGNYYYIDSIREARKVLVEEMSSTLVTIAKDVKIQVEFNPKYVQSYRLIGYENRKMAAQDFNDDKKDAGDIGAGHMVTALYEIVPQGVSVPGSVDPLKYQQNTSVKEASVENASTELLTVKLRYKHPEGGKSQLIEIPFDSKKVNAEVSSETQFASAVALFGMLLRKSPYVQQGSYSQVLEMAQASRGEDKYGYRAEFIDLVKKAQSLSGLRKTLADSNQ